MRDWKVIIVLNLGKSYQPHQEPRHIGYCLGPAPWGVYTGRCMSHQCSDTVHRHTATRPSTRQCLQEKTTDQIHSNTAALFTRHHSHLCTPTWLGRSNVRPCSNIHSFPQCSCSSLLYTPPDQTACIHLHLQISRDQSVCVQCAEHCCVI